MLKTNTALGVRLGKSLALAALAAGSVLSAVAPAQAHHSFAMFDQTKTVTVTGVVYQFVAQANHAEVHFYLLGPDGKLTRGADGKPADFGIEMAGAAAVAEQGITAASLPVGTIISAKVNPMRDGTNFGARAGGTALAKCPWKKPPAAGKACDSVPGAEMLGGKTF